MTTPVPDVFVAGPASWNTIVQVGALPQPRSQTLFADESYETVGGTSAGKALNLAALGRRVALRTVVGTDAAGARVTAHLESAGIEVIAGASSDGRTEKHLNLMDPLGRRVSIYLQTPGEPERVEGLPRRVLEALDAASAIVVDLAPHALPVLTAARERGRDVWVDLHDYDGDSAFHRPWLEQGTHVFLSSDGLPAWRDFLRARIDAGARLAVCTHGADGATALTPESGFLEVDAVPVDDVVDTNGAGDGFFAAFLDAHLRGASTDEALRAAAAHASRVVRSRGLAPA